MIKVCMVVNALNYGGVEKVIENYCFGFDRTEFEFTIITQQSSSSEKHIEYFKEHGFSVIGVTHKKKNLLRNVIEIYKIIKKGNFDVIHCHMSYANCYVLFLGKILKVRNRFNHYHNAFVCQGAKKHLMSICNRICDNYSTMNIFCGEGVKEYFGKTRRESIILNNLIDVNKFRFRYDYRKEIRGKYHIDESAFVLGNIGRFCSQKNQLFVLNVFKKFKGSVNFRALLLLCGDGDDRKEIEDYISNNNLSDSVILTGNTSEPEKIYNAMDFFIFPSRFEGLSLTFLEAQLNGLPCLGSSVLSPEAIISTNVELLDLNLGVEKWSDVIRSKNKKRENLFFDSKVEKFSYAKHHYDLFGIYKSVLSK